MSVYHGKLIVGYRCHMNSRFGIECGELCMNLVLTLIEVNTIVFNFCHSYVNTRSKAVVLFSDFVGGSNLAQTQYGLILVFNSSY